MNGWMGKWMDIAKMAVERCLTGLRLLGLRWTLETLERQMDGWVQIGPVLLVQL